MSKDNKNTDKQFNPQTKEEIAQRVTEASTESLSTKATAHPDVAENVPVEDRPEIIAEEVVNQVTTATDTSDFSAGMVSKDEVTAAGDTPSIKPKG